MAKFSFKRKLPIWQKLLGSIAIIVGIVSLFSDFKGFIALGTGFYLLLTEGSDFDFEQKIYRKTKSILGASIGKWQPLPDIQYLSVFKTKENSTFRSRTAETNVSKDIIRLNLFYNSNQKIEAYNTTAEDDAFTNAKAIASLLNIKILDATTRAPKWL